MVAVSSRSSHRVVIPCPRLHCRGSLYREVASYEVVEMFEVKRYELAELKCRQCGRTPEKEWVKQWLKGR